MAAMKRTTRGSRQSSDSKNPLLNRVAETLGYAAGTVSRATQELTENISAIPQIVTGKVREATRIKGNLQRAEKKIDRTTRTRIAKSASRVGKRPASRKRVTIRSRKRAA
jgi:DNA-binding transcriptional MocR family regulator